MDNQDNQSQQGVAASQSMDAGIAAQAEPVQMPEPNKYQGAETRVLIADEGKALDPAPQAEAAQAPSVEEKLAAQNEANLRQAIENGYKPEAEPSKQERARALVADMEHTVANNGPITIAMLREVRDLLGVDVR